MRSYRVIPPAASWPPAQALVFLTSCGGPAGPTAYPTKGQVMVNGSPAAGVVVALSPSVEEAAKQTEARPLPHAVTGADGTFELSTYGTGDGAPSRGLTVLLNWPAWEGPPQPAPDRLRRFFATAAKSTLHAHVDAKPTTLQPFDLNGVAVLSEQEIQETKKLGKHALRVKSRGREE